MSNIKVNVLDDILENSKKRKNKNLVMNASTVFKKYRAKNEVGKDILETLKKMTNSNKLFYLSETNSSVGLITLSQSLTSLAYLKQYGIKFDTFKEYFVANLTAYFKELRYSPLCNTLDFSASPYVKEDDNLTSTYVDSIAKSLQTFMEIRELIHTTFESNVEEDIESLNSIYVEGVGNIKDVLAAITHCVKICFSKLSDVAIVNNVPAELLDIKYETSDGEVVVGQRNYKGWNYSNVENVSTNSKFEPSLYFTYSVAIAYMSVYENIIDVLNYHRQVIAINERYDQLENDSQYNPNEEGYVTREEALESIKKSDNIAKFSRDNEFYLEVFNEYNRFKKVMKSSGYYIYEKIKNVKIKNDFIGLDYNGIDLQDIKSSTTNNALFNTLFAIVILISSGVADDFVEYQPERRYFELLQIAMENVYDSFCELEQSKKLYIVEQYILNFNEAIPDTLAEEANLLRKQRIQVLSLVPLMVRTYNLVSQYLIQYPQKQMINYLELIMKYRHMNRNNKYEWCWDKDNYDINVNNLFICSLYDFYEYYEKYEKPYTAPEEAIAIEKNNTLKVIKDAEKENEKKINQVLKEKQELQEKMQEEIDRVKYEKANMPIVLAIKEIVRDTMKEELIEILPDVLKQVSEYLVRRNKLMSPSAIKYESGCDNKNERELAGTLIELMLSYFAKEISSSVDEGSIVSDRDEYMKRCKTGEGLLDDETYQGREYDLLTALSKKINDLK